jgi:hypothetical protein
MHNDSLETLLARHYGSTAPSPTGLEQRLNVALRQQVVVQGEQQRMAAHLRTTRMSRRHALRLVALGSASMGLLGAGLELFETALAGQETTSTAIP